MIGTLLIALIGAIAALALVGLAMTRPQAAIPTLLIAAIAVGLYLLTDIAWLAAAFGVVTWLLVYGVEPWRAGYRRFASNSH